MLAATRKARPASVANMPSLIFRVLTPMKTAHEPWTRALLTTVETSPLKRPDHVRPRNGREGAGHQATSRVSVSSSGGPTSASNTSSASRRSATAASAVAPSPTAPTPGRSCAEAHQNAVLVLFDDIRHMDYAGHNADSPTPGARHGSARRAVPGLVRSRRPVQPDRLARICRRRRSPGNGDGQRPNPGISGRSR